MEAARQLLASGTITQAEFDAIKANALGGSAGTGLDPMEGGVRCWW
ncbi:MAG: SHOCT domain-containing protein [Solirubrobacteraceae bacterium]